jgi:hypothetical protein
VLWDVVIFPKKDDEGEEAVEAEEEEEEEEHVEAVLLVDRDPISRSFAISSKISIPDHTRGLKSRGWCPRSPVLSVRLTLRGAGEEVCVCIVIINSSTGTNQGRRHCSTHCTAAALLYDTACLLTCVHTSVLPGWILV